MAEHTNREVCGANAKRPAAKAADAKTDLDGRTKILNAIGVSSARRSIATMTIDFAIDARWAKEAVNALVCQCARAWVGATIDFEQQFLKFANKSSKASPASPAWPTGDNITTPPSVIVEMRKS